MDAIIVLRLLTGRTAGSNSSQTDSQLMLLNEMSLRRLYESDVVISIADPPARWLSRLQYSEAYPGSAYKLPSPIDNHVSERHTIENAWSIIERNACRSS